MSHPRPPASDASAVVAGLNRDFEVALEQFRTLAEIVRRYRCALERIAQGDLLGSSATAVAREAIGRAPDDSTDSQHAN